MAQPLYDCPLKCARGRHREGHPHLNAQPEEPEASTGNVVIKDAPISVTGADSPESLAAQAQAAIAAEQKRGPQISKSKEQREVEEKAARLIAMRPLARKLSTAPYTALAIATFDDRWMKIKEEETLALEQATLNVMLAWGVDFSGKWSSVSALAFCHAEIIALKLKQFYEEEQRAQKVSDAVTQKPGDTIPKVQ
jgi:hypothetical protein